LIADHNSGINTFILHLTSSRKAPRGFVFYCGILITVHVLRINVKLTTLYSNVWHICCLF